MNTDNVYRPISVRDRLAMLRPNPARVALLNQAIAAHRRYLRWDAAKQHDKQSGRANTGIHAAYPHTTVFDVLDHVWATDTLAWSRMMSLVLMAYEEGIARV